MPHWKLERSIEEIVVGVDEVGCAPLAGPVVAAAVLLDPKLPRRLARRIDDSKKLPPEEREEIFARLPEHAKFGVGEASVDEIEQFNILRAAQLAMRRAVEALGLTPALIIVDGNRLPGFSFPTRCVVGRRRDQPLHRRRLHHRQGDARPHDEGAGGELSRLWLGAQCRLSHAGAPGGAPPVGAHAPSPAHI